MPNGVTIDRSSAAFLARPTGDTEAEDDYGYTLAKAQKKYKRMAAKNGGQIHLVTLNKGSNGLGISLAGHKDRAQMAIYICGLNPQGNAARFGDLQVRTYEINFLIGLIFMRQ